MRWEYSELASEARTYFEENGCSLPAAARHVVRSHGLDRVQRRVNIIVRRIKAQLDEEEAAEDWYRERRSVERERQALLDPSLQRRDAELSLDQQ